MNRHRNLPVWQSARELVKEVYGLTRELPPGEKHVATAQLRRAAWSVPNNIAEGNAKLGRAELRRFLDIALGSLAEVDSMVAILGDVHPLDPDRVARIDERRAEITRGIFGLLRKSRPK